jgi:type I restriction enzyme S subunit
VSLIKGRSYASSELKESPTALVTLGSFQRGGGYRPDGLKGFTGRYHEEQVVAAGELVVAITDVTQAAEVIGRAAIVRSDRKYERLVASLDVIIVRPIVDALSPLFLYELLRSRDYLDHISGYTNGTTVLHLDVEGLRRYLLTMPGPNVLKAFESFARGVFKRNTINEAEGENLALLRDRLIPELISGKVRLTDAEKQVSEAL